MGPGIRKDELRIRMGTTGAAGWIDEIPWKSPNDPSLREIDETDDKPDERAGEQQAMK